MKIAISQYMIPHCLANYARTERSSTPFIYDRSLTQEWASQQQFCCIGLSLPRASIVRSLQHSTWLTPDKEQRHWRNRRRQGQSTGQCFFFPQKQWDAQYWCARCIFLSQKVHTASKHALIFLRAFQEIKGCKQDRNTWHCLANYIHPVNHRAGWLLMVNYPQTCYIHYTTKHRHAFIPVI